MRNLHKCYYKDYFSDKTENIIDPTDNQNARRIDASIDWTDIKCEKNKRVIKMRNSHLISATLPESEPNPIVNQSFELRISYPGLVTGIGINHEASIEGEFKLGVHFDWTHGMPVVYGSSVKGMLRAWFMEFYKTSEKKYYECGIDAGDLMMNVFEGVYDRDMDAEKKKYGKDWEDKVKNPEKRIYKSHKSIYNRDIFFDAVITQADSKGRILASDSITPHDDNPLNEPTPLTFMKIASGCRMGFRFKLVDTIIDDKKFTAAQKKTLFEEILKTVGVGAKTNVGYGQLK